MANGYSVPIITLTGASFFNKWYSDNQIDIKIPVAGGVAYVIASLLSEAPDVEPVVTGIAWVALVAWVITDQTLINNLQGLVRG